MRFCITREQLWEALNEIEKAHDRGFVSSLAVFQITEAGPCLDDTKATYDSLCDRGDPNDPKQDWGNQGASNWNRVVDGKLVPITK